MYHHRIDHHPVADQTSFDDPRRNRGRRYAAFFAAPTGALFTLGRHHEVLGRLDIQLFADIVADDILGLSAGWAGALFRSSGNHALHARQRGRQLLASRTGAGRWTLRWNRQRFALALRLNFDVAYPRLQF